LLMCLVTIAIHALLILAKMDNAPMLQKHAMTAIVVQVIPVIPRLEIVITQTLVPLAKEVICA